eukprot:CAMPEP_0181208644 /NCGR_PEP_ID=MMETSP1096-20121128/22232_1 /TAXON_ID=156174 ORGANISM="Chrysochromulina ericina, Strain CCMP281" /NCGR_SAMPLE_ID=MMETSP1096 /ASSEMBLY_ACC=CAM_ASM_000453 /LENGTH=233 /DNA_ID=CAMNT_0023299731 /DNA_START=130 /DNA_END=832 /DNA_ORIENTATION=+
MDTSNDSRSRDAIDQKNSDNYADEGEDVVEDADDVEGSVNEEETGEDESCEVRDQGDEEKVMEAAVGAMRTKERPRKTETSAKRARLPEWKPISIVQDGGRLAERRRAKQLAKLTKYHKKEAAEEERRARREAEQMAKHATAGDDANASRPKPGDGGPALRLPDPMSKRSKKREAMESGKQERSYAPWFGRKGKGKGEGMGKGGGSGGIAKCGGRGAARGKGGVGRGGGTERQ